MQHFQDTETGQIHAFDDGVDPFKLGYRSIPKTLSATVIPKPSEDHVWFKGAWIHRSQAPQGYESPVSSVPSYDPAWHSFLTPYTWVLKEGEDFSVSLEQINANTYAGDKLAEPVTALTIAGATALVSRDGAVALPMEGDLAEQHCAVEIMNRLFCALLIGGLYAESVAHNEVLAGCLGEDRRLFVYVPTRHGRFRHMDAAITERIRLLHPRVIWVPQLQEAFAQGMDVLDRVHDLSPYFLLHGFTSLQHQNLSDALSSLWITVEQLTAFLLKEDGNGFRRNASVAEKHKLLFERGRLSEDCYSRLDTARQARNDLLHEGKAPGIEPVVGLWPAICEMLTTASGVVMARLQEMRHWNHQRGNRVGHTNFDGWQAVVQALSQ